MSPATRLGFRYWGRGADSLRVQTYGQMGKYHRGLIREHLPQAAWRRATAAMPQSRRPDGTGGPRPRTSGVTTFSFTFRSKQS